MMTDVHKFIKLYNGDKYSQIPRVNFAEHIFPLTNRFRPILVILGPSIDAKKEVQTMKTKSPHFKQEFEFVPCNSGKVLEMTMTIIKAAV
jgi:hypothetical protein